MKHAHRGFTLLEMMIVVAIIAILAAIAVPALLRARIAANEVNCQASLKQFVTTEGVWKQTDADRNTMQDYWTNDVAGFYAFTDAVGDSLRLIDIALAVSDTNGWPVYTLPPFSMNSSASDRSGYYFSAMVTNETGSPYRFDPDGDGFMTHPTKFAFCGSPYVYNSTGVRQFIVDEGGTVFQQDLGTSNPTLTWPAADPSTLGWVPSE